MFLLQGKIARNRARIIVIRDQAPTAVEAFARMFTDPHISDDGTIVGRLRAIFAVTEHRFVPGLHTRLTIGLTGFRKEFEDPWPTSSDQVGHFLTAVRLSFDPRFLSNPIFPLLLGGFGEAELPVKLMIGHEKMPDPPDVSKMNLKTLFATLSCFRAQYQSVTKQDVLDFCNGQLDDIQVGNGLGNSMADLRLSYLGWLFGHWISAGKFETADEIASWIKTEIGNG